MLGLSQSLAPRQTIHQEQRLTQSQKQEIKASLLLRRLDLVASIHGERYEPRAQCPNLKCQRKLTPLEIIAGFRNDPTDYTTACTSCHTRFEPKLVYSSDVARAEIPFYCATQVLAQLRGLEMLPPEEIQKNQPAIYHSVRVHHGNFRVAFEKIGIQYPFETITNWKEKVQDFLGKLPDTVIAEVVDMSVGTVRALRKSLRIKAFQLRDVLSD